MHKYPIVAVLWNDPHIMLRSQLPNGTVKDIIVPTLTVGILHEQTDEYVSIIHNLERSEGFDESDYTIIFSGCVVSIQEYGKIKLRKIRPREA